MRSTADNRNSKRTIRPAWIALALCLFVVAGFTVAIAVWGIEPAPDAQQNPGVLALYEFIRSCEQNQSKVRQGLPGALHERLLDEPFEVETHIDLTADGLSVMGLPLSRVLAGIDIKYDMSDLGLKANVMGFPVAGAYLINQTLVLDIGDSAQAYSLGALPDGPMPLRERLGAMLPYLPDSEADRSRLVAAVAQAVPYDCSSELTADVYSPMDGKDVRMEAVYTQLDAQAISQTAAALLEQLIANPALSADMLAVLDPLMFMSGTAQADVLTSLQALAEGTPDDAALAWTVYRYDGQYVGCRFGVTREDEVIEWTVMAQFGASAQFGYWSAHVNGESVMDAEFGIDYQQGSISSDITLPDFYMSFRGAFEMGQRTRDDYYIKASLTISGEALGMVLTDAPCDIDMNIRFGELGTLAESRRWRDIYDKEWKDAHQGG